LKYLGSSKYFKRQIKKLPPHDQEKTSKTLKEFLGMLRQGTMPVGFGFKKIGEKHYELRIDIRLRILMKAETDTLICHFIGNHDDVERCLKNYRNK